MKIDTHNILGDRFSSIFQKLTTIKTTGSRTIRVHVFFVQINYDTAIRITRDNRR